MAKLKIKDKNGKLFNDKDKNPLFPSDTPLDGIKELWGLERIFIKWQETRYELWTENEIYLVNPEYPDLRLRLVDGILFNDHTGEKIADLEVVTTSDILRRQPNEYNDVFDLEILLDDAFRKEKLEELFVNFIVPFTNKALSRKQILDLEKTNELGLLSSVKEELEKLENT